mmetsp:Transcript_4510/g.6915  ORF Transcript_4510/g.6915 Transcript_4510/m.6915 type:complete len:195 (+) Transcript_4510:104-688(+)
MPRSPGKAALPSFSPVKKEINFPEVMARCCRRGAADKISRLIELGCDVDLILDDNGSRPLHIVSQYGHCPCISLLISHGCTIDTQDFSGLTPCALACLHARRQALHLLVEHGCSIHIVDNALCSPSWHAAKRGYPDIIEYLASKGADIYAPNENGVTPSLAAAASGCVNVLQWYEEEAGIELSEDHFKILGSLT